MKKTIRNLIIGVAAVPLMAVGVVGATQSAMVTDVSASTGLQGAVDATEDAAGTKATDVDSMVKNVINALLYVIGVASVIMLIYGGIRYTTSGGSSSAVTSAKSTIIYAIIGLVIALLAYAVVNWILTDLFA